MKCGKCRLDADCGLVGINAHGQVVQDNVDDVVPDLARVVRIVREGLVICDQNVDLVELARVLKLHTAPERPDIVSEMETSRGAVSRKYYLLLGVIHGNKLLSVYPTESC